MREINNQRDRYPGIRSFETHEENLFYGRDKEKKALYEEVAVRNLVVVFAKSGMGKSSLINAGLIPQLLRSNHYPIRVRLQDQKDEKGAILSPLQTVKQTLANYCNNKSKQPEHLWEMLNECQFPYPNLVLVFDQFEEFFNHEATLQAEFAQELSEILNTFPPVRLQGMDTQRPNVKILIAIRADRLYELNALSKHLPLVLQNRFELLPLSQENAREAIVKPALRKGRLFSTPVFEFEKQFQDDILDSLSERGKKSIESFQLQIICEQVERRVRQYPPQMESNTIEGTDGKTYSDDEMNIVVNKNDLAYANETIAQAIQRILGDYYKEQLRQLQQKYAQESNLHQLIAQVRNFIEDKLIDAPEDSTQGKRKLSGESPMFTGNKALNEEILQYLINQRLIRKEILSDERFYYEITHDTLVEPILKARLERKLEERAEKERLAREEQERKLQAQLELEREKQKKADEERAKQAKQLRTTRILLAVALIALIAAIAAVFWAVKESQNANLKRQEAQMALDKYEQEKKQKEEEVHKNNQKRIVEIFSKIERVEEGIALANGVITPATKDVLLNNIDSILKIEPSNAKALELLKKYKN